jgi:hypothetical protein
MKFEISKDLLEEMICCIVDCGMDRDEACDYALRCLNENLEDAEVSNG